MPTPRDEGSPADWTTAFDVMAGTVCRGAVPEGTIRRAIGLYKRSGYLRSTEWCVVEALVQMGYMVNRCMYQSCGAWLGIVDGGGVAGVSHGICPACYAREVEAMNKAKEAA